MDADEHFRQRAAATTEDLNHNSLHRCLNEKCDVKVAGAGETIEAALAEGDLVAELEVPPGAALLVVRRRSDTADGTPVEYVLHFRADRYRLHLETGVVLQR
jgi:GntR family transcriptional regulator